MDPQPAPWWYPLCSSVYNPFCILFGTLFFFLLLIIDACIYVILLFGSNYSPNDCPKCQREGPGHHREHVAIKWRKCYYDGLW